MNQTINVNSSTQTINVNPQTQGISLVKSGPVGPPGPEGPPGLSGDEAISVHVLDPTPHPVYDDMVSLSSLLANALI